MLAYEVQPDIVRAGHGPDVLGAAHAHSSYLLGSLVDAALLESPEYGRWITFSLPSEPFRLATTNL